MTPQTNNRPLNILGIQRAIIFVYSDVSFA